MLIGACPGVIGATTTKHIFSTELSLTSGWRIPIQGVKHQYYNYFFIFNINFHLSKMFGSLFHNTYWGLKPMLIVYNFKYSWSITLPDKWKYSGRPKQPTILTRFDIIIHIKVIAKPPFIQINIQKRYWWVIY